MRSAMQTCEYGVVGRSRATLVGIWRRIELGLFLLALGACGSDGVSNPVSSAVLVGRLERGGTVKVFLKDVAGTQTAATSVTISPASAGAVSGNSIQLLQTGSAMISASAAGVTGSTSATISAPPTIFFDAVDRGNRDIFSVTLDGQDAKRWTTDIADDQEPTVAKGKLVFATTRNGNFDLYAITIANGSERRLTTAVTNETQPSLSNDSTRLVYSNDVSGLSRIWLASGDATNGVALTPASFGSGSGIEVNAKWSSTGDKLILTGTANGRANLFAVVSAAGSTPAAVAGSTSQNTDVEPALSPDGNRIVFASTRLGGTSLFIVDTRTSAVTQLTSNNSDGQPDWLPDGRIVFTRFNGSATSLNWIDPEDVASGVHAIAIAPARPQHPAASR